MRISIYVQWDFISPQKQQNVVNFVCYEIVKHVNPIFFVKHECPFKHTVVNTK